MNKGSGIFFLAILLAGGGYYYYHTQLSSSFLERNEVTINGEKYDVRSKEGRERYGLKLRMIPNKDNAAILYCKASNVFDEPSGRADDALREADVTDPAFKRWYEKNKECLALIRRAARRKDCQFPVLGKDDEPIGAMPLPYLNGMRRFAWLLRCEGRRLGQKGDWSAALDCCVAINRMARHICRSDRPMISILVALMVHEIGNGSVEECLANGDLDEAALRKAVQDHHQALKDFPGFAHVMTFEQKVGEIDAGAQRKMKETFTRGQARLGGATIFAAIKLYEKKNSRPPRSLAELKGDCLSELPKDPFSGRDFVYKVRGSDWILYSVWENRTDDGGVGSWPHNRQKDRDFIWRNTRLPVN